MSRYFEFEVELEPLEKAIPHKKALQLKKEINNAFYYSGGVTGGPYCTDNIITIEGTTQAPHFGPIQDELIAAVKKVLGEKPEVLAVVRYRDVTEKPWDGEDSVQL